ncbi:hypothetical protein F9C07_6888 [Aspergillus flavus]|uniref:Uncharacterized protein n=1 Tax=Aspergillus flavus (strain ATCC 200026 / FGSC A1120 / IAM 13836 / NRRL 3357 / JCM 12722 / SRRC 167) TaxID=332952 RepID=A0A7U2MH17_ASPFN|nr:hypothetical protein F9C07_6888 [Aspergillus flavus]
MASTTLSSRCRVCGKRRIFVECLTCKAMLQNAENDWDNLDFLSFDEQSMSSSDTIFPHESRYQTHTFVPESPVVARSIISIDEENLQQMVKKLNRKLDRHYTAITREQRRILQSSPGPSRCLATMPPVYSTESKK